MFVRRYLERTRSRGPGLLSAFGLAHLDIPLAMAQATNICSSKKLLKNVTKKLTYMYTKHSGYVKRTYTCTGHDVNSVLAKYARTLTCAKYFCENVALSTPNKTVTHAQRERSVKE